MLKIDKQLSLSCGERAVRCLLGEPVDRVPFGLGFGGWGETYRRWHRETGDPHMIVQTRLGFDQAFVCPALEAGPWPAFPEEVLEETVEHVIERNARGIVLRTLHARESMPEFLEYPVRTPMDWERMKDERLRLDDARRVTQDWNALRAQVRQTGQGVQVGTYPWGVFGTPRDFLGVEQLLVAFYDEPVMIRDMMEHLTSLWLELWARVAAEVQIDHIHIWEDMAGRQGSLISPAMIEEFMMPCYDRIAVFAREHGVRLVSVDSDGEVSQLVPIMMRHGVNLFVPFEVAAGCDIGVYQERYPTLGIIGGLDKRALARTRGDIDKELAKAAAWTAAGRYIPAFDHLIPPDVPWENFRYAMERLRDICYG